MSYFRLKLDKLSNFFRHSTGERKIDVRKVIYVGITITCLFPFVGPFIPGQYDVSSNHTTIRKEELRKIREEIMNKGKDRFIVVQGPAGLGKTTLVEDAVSEFNAVVVAISPGKSKEEIIDSVTHAVAGFFPPVIWGLSYWQWVINYRAFFSDKPFVVVLSGASRNANEKPASLASASRSISKQFEGKVVVIVDSSNNAYAPEEDKANYRDELNIQLFPLKKEELLGLPQFSKFKESPKYGQISNDIYAVFGGVPLDWDKTTILSIFKDKLTNEKARVDAIYSLLTERVNREYALLKPFFSDFGEVVKRKTGYEKKELEERKKSFLEAIYSEFSKPSSGLDVSSRFLMYPDSEFIPSGNKVIRQIGLDYFPRTPVMAFILRHNIRKDITVDELKAFIKKDHENRITLQPANTSTRALHILNPMNLEGNSSITLVIHPDASAFHMHAYGRTIVYLTGAINNFDVILIEDHCVFVG